MSPFPPPDGVPSVQVGGFEACWHDLGSAAQPGFGIYVPTDPDAPLDAMTEAELEASDERMPYFASLWPSGDSLAEFLLGVEDLCGYRALDLGCGVGAQGLALAWGGAEVTFLDWESRALELVAHSARALELELGGCVVGDWRTYEPARPFEIVLGADLLYEARNVPAVHRALGELLAPGGAAWIADPGRDGLEPFIAGLSAAGLHLTQRRLLPPRPHGVDVTLLVVHRYPQPS